ncbi:phosphoinositide 3-kinase regulatory subunit 4 [Schistocerca cancellata]|uniref:phosphoinositide 3-kinase regulatory subunit 4 n=1 Tax=Schistocerca cancellata TaxID=274614 RepID=UPI0021192006|nr:phosphoinositide 3-kinase regulatory subunit 4 [Schistocerca cancellata]
MGNQLVGIAPSQIFPVEHYLTEHSDLHFDVNLGSTRFFKVARAKSQEGLIVVKVFAIHDPTLPLQQYKDRVEDIRNQLQGAVNCIPFQKAVLTDKAAFLMREYVKYSLYDRISTRPFLTAIEKKWIAFQLLYALHQCHKVGVCHGDIKLENIMITSWNWVLLVDFASFKPTYLPEDNPADFSYFFDTSRRRTCYIAPERFIKTLNSDISSQLLLPEETSRRGDLTPAMDIFSAGCALLELFNEGHPPFDFSQLLSYHSGEYNVSRHLEKLDDPDIKKLLRDMLQRDPTKRQSAEIYLDQQRGKAFPEYFYSFLQSYMHFFSAAPIVSPDEKIARLRKDVNNIINILKPVPEAEKRPADQDDSDSDIPNGSDGLVIITALVTSCIRGLHYCTSKLQSLDILLELAAHTSAETVLDRILPYVFHLVHDTYPRVRVRAIQALTKCLTMVKTIPCSDANIFPEYVLPGLAQVTHDEAVIVRAAYAENIAELAETALRYLEHTQISSSPHGEAPRPSYETELQTLHEMIQQTVANLLTDPQNLVKQTLMENGITKLCVFFGKQKANDVLLSHMITFLNDKEDRHLRGSFFDCIVGVAAYVGWHCSPILTPLLQQGLTDPEEFVIVKAINAMKALTELSLLQKSALYELLKDTTCFLVHPNLWIIQAVVGFLSAIARTLNLVDVQCKVMAVIQPYLKNQVIQADKEVLLLNALVSPIPRQVYDGVLRCSDFDLLSEALQERHNMRSMLRAGHMPQQSELHPSLKNLFRRLTSDGMDETVEEQLFAMLHHLNKIHQHRVTAEARMAEQKASEGKIDLSSLKNPVLCHTVQLKLDNISKTDIAAAGIARKKQSIKKPPALESHMTTMNEEWQTMFGTSDLQSPSTRYSDGGSMSPPTSSMTGDAQSSPQHSIEADHSIHERSYIQYRCAPCRLELRQLTARRQELHRVALQGREQLDEQEVWEPPLLPPTWRLRGALVAHLHEHRGAVNRLVSIPETTLFASCSADGYIRLWDCGKMEGRNIANRSRQVYNRQAGPLVGLTVCEGNQSLGSASQTGAIFVLRVEPNSNKMTVLQSRQLDLQEDGCAVDMNYFDSGSQSVLVYATMYGSIVGWDLRAPGNAWKLDNDLNKGVITSFCLDSKQSWLTLGTTSGFHICWDLRFQLPITSILHPTGARVRRLVRHPVEHSWVMSAVQGNNEISFWNLETQFRQAVLWASSAPPLSHTQVHQNSVCAMYAGCVDRSPFVITGGTDMRVRFWDLESPNESYLAIPAANDSVTPSTVCYKSRLVDGTNVVQEVQKPRSQSAGVQRQRSNEEAPRPGPDQPQAGHHDWISEVAMCQASQCFLLTGSRDGVIKVWK